MLATEAALGEDSAEDAVDAYLRALLEATVREMGAERGCLVQDGVSGASITIQVLGPEADGVEVPAQISWGVVRRVLTTGKAEVHEDALAEECMGIHRSIAQLNLKSLACVPVMSGRVVAGVLYFDHHRAAGRFSRGKVECARYCAARVGSRLRIQSLEECVSRLGGELQLANAHIVRGERNRAMGETLAGLGHDLKNVLTAIIARCQLTRQRATDAGARDALEGIERAAVVGADLLRKLQECSRDHRTQPCEDVSIGDMAHEAIELMRPHMSKEKAISVVESYQDCACVSCVPGEMREVFLNLLSNACDAMPMGGTLSVTVAVVEELERVDVRVADSGCGMSTEVASRAFEPFFTSKGKNGTGLGLALARDVVLRCGGKIALETSPGNGCTVTMAFPLAMKGKRRGQGLVPPVTPEGLPPSRWPSG